jgi:energy-coupling factor transporter ATP-binding protein EcfA2
MAIEVEVEQGVEQRKVQEQEIQAELEVMVKMVKMVHQLQLQPHYLA